ncbi:Nif3-like dinuclear metal center hexameric protein [Luteibaculum oceani]|uniref:GTP cyclohydrolase 1 type 2 homolog n=1 Tax=Luteibaculum oceani TaxID=1294296 RepID=A0A5C6V1V4_9FLAO|nr:Nif3-like dinuclear metal center hexameric protein [Luteibaculum oceani]TXC78386.1 Nif3-like dinuclear metal center hexameric protein [Luteibaculum oceani]
MKVGDILSFLENKAHPSLQEGYDNSGLIVGNRLDECSGVIVSLDCTEEVIEEAIENNANLVVSHHPILFGGIKSLTGANYVERTIIKAIKNGISIYAIHTNLDNVAHGVNAKIAEVIGLVNTRILSPKKGLLQKLVVYGTEEDISKMRSAIFNVGGGEIGEYSECSFHHTGTGSFKPNSNANPTIGEKNKRTEQPEYRCEILVPNYLMNACLQAAKEASSYEELAYDIVSLENINQTIGSGMLGELQEPMSTLDFLASVKSKFGCGVIRYSGAAKSIKTVALCGGSGFFLLGAAKKAKADIYITSDVKYHQFFDAENDLILADIGHYESEQFTINLLADLLKKNFPTFAVRLTSKNTNPVNYI